LMGDNEEAIAEGEEDEEVFTEGEQKQMPSGEGEETGIGEGSKEETLVNAIEGEGPEKKGQQSLGKLDPKRVIEAALFISSKPLTLEELGKYIGVAAPGFVEGIVKELSSGYDASGSSIKIAQEPGGYIMRLRPEYASKVSSLAQEAELSRGALKILAYISQNEGIEQSKVAGRLGSTVYDYVHELVDKGFLNKEKRGRTSVLSTTQKFRDYFGA